MKNKIKKYLDKNNFEKLDTKAVFFDMDGVLFDSMPNHANSWSKAFTEIGIDFPIYEGYMNEGQPGYTTIEITYRKHFKREATKEECKSLYDRKSEIFSTCGMPPQIPYARRLIQTLLDKGLKIFVVTGSGHRKLLNYLLENYPEIKPENVVSALMVKKGKPAPEPYLKALELSGLKAHEALVVENAPLGVQSASAAKIFTLAVNTGPLEKEVLLENGADAVFDSMEDLYFELKEKNSIVASN